MKRKTCARKCERACCTTVTYFPLVFVYGLTTWGAWVLAHMGLRSDTRSIINTAASAVGILLYLLLNWSYTTAVFTPPGSPTSARTGYSSLPTHEATATSFTVKSTGETRFCKKCQARKPDRAHHCSTCNRCVLKMDHHCPWLATCVGLRNYKAFLLFLTYTTFFCWICFGATSRWLWSEVFTDARYTESLMPVNYVLLCVIAGIIGLVLTGFTGWHLSLAMRGLTTIECLEKTRYLSPLKKTMHKQQLYRDAANGSEETQGYGQQLAEIHANVLPSVTRPEEGETMLSLSNDHDHDPELGLSSENNAGRTSGTTTRHPQAKPHRSYASLERSRERSRYEDYLDEQASSKLPNAFDLGWKRNLVHLLGPRPLFWALPICNTTGDGWKWEANPKWIQARDALRREGERERAWDDERGGREDEDDWRGDHRYHDGSGWEADDGRHYLPNSNGGLNGLPGYPDHHDSDGRPESHMSMKTLRRNVDFDGDERFEVSSDDDNEDDDFDGSHHVRQDNLDDAGDDIIHHGGRSIGEQRKDD